MATAAGTSFQELLDAVGGYYGTGSDQWVEVAKYGLRADNLAEILHQVPGVQAHVNRSGSVIGYSVDSNIALNDGGVGTSLINSNTQTGTAAASNTTSVRTLGNFTNDPQTGNVSATNKIPKKTGGISGTAEAVVGTVSAVAVGAGVGLTLGRTINNAIYEHNPDFWYNIVDAPEGSEAAEEWAKITAIYDEIDKDGKITHFLNVIAGIDDSNDKATVYMDENAFAYYAWRLKAEQFFDDGSITYPTKPTAVGEYTVTSLGTLAAAITGMSYTMNANLRPALFSSLSDLETEFAGYPIIAVYKYSVNNFIVTGYKRYDGESIIGTTFNTTSQSISGHDVYSIPLNGNNQYAHIERVVIVQSDGTYQIGQVGANVVNPAIGRVLCGNTTGSPFYTSNINITQTSALPGVERDPRAVQPNTSSWDTPQNTLGSLKNQYPDLWNNAYQNDVVNPDGTTSTTNYIPIALPASYTNGNPITVDNPTSQSNPAVGTDTPNVTDDLLRTIIAILTKPSTTPSTITDPKTDDPTNTEPNPPDTGSGITPPLVVPVGSASALWAVYNPTQAEINSLGAWLWSNNFVDQLLKMFNDPMQAIIGLHKTFIPPVTGPAQDIKVGYLNSGVSSLTVPTQYNTVDCGTVDCAEYFGNVFDYSPYTRVYIYLPFIGFKELDVAQVMRSKINVKYRGDSYTGACLAEVTVTRDSESGGVLYSYSGDCAARYPLSHGSYMGIVNAIAGIGIGIGTAIAGAPSIGIAGAIGMAQHARASVEHSGSFTGNSGAMGIKKPYLVVMRPQTAMANNYEHFTGQPSNSNVVLGSATGYVRVKECHVEDIATATDAEKQMIESALKTGVII